MDKPTLLQTGRGVQLQAAYDKAAKYDKRLTAYDTRFNNSVSIVHMDGSNRLLHNAFVLMDETYYYIFCEHYDTIVASRDEVDYIYYMKTILIEDFLK